MVVRYWDLFNSYKKNRSLIIIWSGDMDLKKKLLFTQFVINKLHLRENEGKKFADSTAIFFRFERIEIQL